MKISKLYKLFCETNGVSIDSREKNIDGMFFALKGEKFDANKFAKQALENGCKYAIVDNEKFAVDNRYIVVNNVLDTLQELAAYHRNELGIPILAITGTNGKTTTKELIFRVLLKKYKVKATIGNLNNHIGVPLTLLSITKDTEFGIVEMGANHIGEIESLCKIAKPNYGIITNIGKAHLEGFGSFENVIKAKTELFDYLNNNEGVILYNDENELLCDIVNNYSCDKIKYSASKNTQLIESNPILKISINERIVKTHLFGEYNIENIKSAVCVGNLFNIEIEKICKAIETYTPNNNRSQLLNTNNNIVFLDAYNANPTSVELSLKSFAKQDFTDKAIILGEMLELGKDSIIEHEKILRIINESNIIEVYLVGKVFSNIKLGNNYKKYIDVDNLIEWQKLNRINNKHILIKGSRGIALEKIVEYL
ncbi:MAG: UDP-N-acetylmuramoyl-tripeptide--D-alanyl-D-alanine ligase [Bacteroidota bacterium]|nr:UDP-N-acetylmuramoyl-tripeptide--D-alanyl-D-alanine ligase [Bacteroidota bacterium]